MKAGLQSTCRNAKERCSPQKRKMERLHEKARACTNAPLALLASSSIEEPSGKNTQHRHNLLESSTVIRRPVLNGATPNENLIRQNLFAMNSAMYQHSRNGPAAVQRSPHAAARQRGVGRLGTPPFSIPLFHSGQEPRNIEFFVHEHLADNLTCRRANDPGRAFSLHC